MGVGGDALECTLECGIVYWMKVKGPRRTSQFPSLTLTLSTSN
jgi:hypothetical protein